MDHELSRASVPAMATHDNSHPDYGCLGRDASHGSLGTAAADGTPTQLWRETFRLVSLENISDAVTAYVTFTFPEPMHFTG